MKSKKYCNTMIMVIIMNYDFMINKVLEKLDNAELELLYNIVTNLDKDE